MATLDVPSDCAFTKHGTFNDRGTYPVPPLTTIRGLLYAALGRPSVLLQGSARGRRWEREELDTELAFRETFAEETHIGIAVDEPGKTDRNLAVRMKNAEPKNPYQYHSAPVTEETLFGPTYTVVIATAEKRLDTVVGALKDPERLLYLGRSDDLVDIRNVRQTDLTSVAETTTLEGVVTPGSDGSTDPVMLPIETETVGSHSARPGRVEMVSIGGTVEEYCRYQTETGDRPIVFLD
jgi:CRISPR-associated Cas5-like protein